MPKILDAILMCRGCERPTLHLFHERRQSPKGPGPAPVGPVFLDLVYTCDVCETERLWGNEPAIAAGVATEREAREEHAVLVHGMRAIDCPACRGLAIDCTECGDSGEVWHWDMPGSCGPGCLLDQPEGR